MTMDAKHSSENGLYRYAAAIARKDAVAMADHYTVFAAITIR